MNEPRRQEIRPLYLDTNIDFDLAFPESGSAFLDLYDNLKLEGKLYDLNLKNEFSKSLCMIIYISLKTEWFESLSARSRKSLINHLSNFVEWLYFASISKKNCYSVLKDFESHRVNIAGVKPQSTGVRQVLYFLNHGLYSTNQYDQSTIQYITHLMRSTVISIGETPESFTLTNFFASMPWLKEIMGERAYLSLESPKRLIDSFSIVIATTLFFILKTKETARMRVEDQSVLTEGVSGTYTRPDYLRLSGNLLFHLAEMKNDTLAYDDLTELVLLDCVPASRRDDLISVSKKYKKKKNLAFNRYKGGPQLFTLPHIFHPKTWTCQSELEELLFSWLCAWQTVQPSDISKLKHQDFVIHKNKNGRPISLQISYYKGRSGKTQFPQMLDARSIEGQAIIFYLEQASSQKLRLCSLRPIDLAFSVLALPERLNRLFTSPIIKNKIEKNLLQRQSTSVFLDAFTAMASRGEFTYGKWKSKQTNLGLDHSISAYRSTVEYTFPIEIFTPGFIKNSSIHSRSDRYRDLDLINDNSHNASTEKISYLTDANKEWVNQNGRITRMVLHDISGYVYKPNIDYALQKAREMNLRTKITDALNYSSNNKSPYFLKSLNSDIEEKSFFKINVSLSEEIIVLDTPETVVQMLHYIQQAELKQRILITHALQFFEETVLPTVEWMQTLLQEQLSPISIREGNKSYKTIHTILPDLFYNELRGGFGL